MGGAILSFAHGFVVLAGETADANLGIVLGPFFFAVGILSLLGAVQRYRLSVLVKNTPSESIQSVAMGRTEVYGTGRTTENPCEAPFSGDPCLYASWDIDRFKDAQDKWVPVDDGSVGEPFYLTDEEEQLLVDDPADATVTASTMNSREWIYKPDEQEHDEITRFCEERDIDTSEPMRYTEKTLSPDQNVYVFGEATRLDPDSPYESTRDICIERDSDTGKFVLADEKERDLAAKYRKQTFGYLLVAFVLAPFGLGVTVHAMNVISIL